MPAASTRPYTVTSGLGAGAGAALAMLLVMGLMRFIFGFLTIPELMLNTILKVMGGQAFSDALDRLYYAGRPLLFAVILEGTLLLRRAPRPPVRCRRPPQPLDGHTPRSIQHPLGRPSLWPPHRPAPQRSFPPSSRPAYLRRNSLRPLHIVRHTALARLDLPVPCLRAGAPGSFASTEHHHGRDRLNALPPPGRKQARLPPYRRRHPPGPLRRLCLHPHRHDNQPGRLHQPRRQQEPRPRRRRQTDATSDLAAPSTSTPAAVAQSNPPPTVTAQPPPTQTKPLPTEPPPTETAVAQAEPSSTPVEVAEAPPPTNSPEPPPPPPTDTPQPPPPPTGTPIPPAPTIAPPDIEVSEITPVASFYHVSKNFFDPSPASAGWKLSVAAWSKTPTPSPTPP